MCSRNFDSNLITSIPSTNFIALVKKLLTNMYELVFCTAFTVAIRLRFYSVWLFDCEELY